MSPTNHTLSLDGVAKKASDLSRSRLMIASVMFGVIFAVLAGRLVQLSVWPQTEAKTAFKQQALAAVSRADVTDRNGAILATDLNTASLFADTRKIWDAEEVANALIGVLPDLDRQSLLRKLGSGQAFVWLKRDLTPKQQDAVYRLGIPNLGFRPEPHRVYPYGRLAAHVMGYVDTDNHGLAGIDPRGRRDLDHLRGAAVGAGEDAVFERDRREDVHAAEGGDLLFEERVAAVGVDRGELRARLHQQGGRVAEFGERRRGERGAHHAAAIGELPPQDFAAGFVDLHRARPGHISQGNHARCVVGKHHARALGRNVVNDRHAPVFRQAGHLHRL